jgi:anti-anti-sigma factor
MEIDYTDLPDGVRRIRLRGRMDVAGAEEIDLRLTSLVSTRQTFVVIDLEGVDFMSSMGLGTLVRNAKAVAARQGRMVLLNPAPNVARMLETTRVAEVLPVFAEFEAARRAVVSDASAAP